MVSHGAPVPGRPAISCNKAAAGKADEINTCIGCNQACLDHTFGGKITSCLVNPRACHETLLIDMPGASAKTHRRGRCRPGRAGFCHRPRPQRGFDVTLFDAASEIGGQFNMAKQVPGKEEFYETLRYFGKQIELTGVKLQLNQQGQRPGPGGRRASSRWCWPPASRRARRDIEGIDHPKVLGYLDVLRDKKPVGKTVALIGAGGIGFDVAEFLMHEGASPSLDTAKFFAEWGVDTTYGARGGLKPAHIEKSPRKVYLLQRKASKVGDGLGKTTGWIHRTSLEEPRGRDGHRRHLPQGGRCRPAHHRGRQGDDHARRHRGASAPARTRSANCRPICRRPAAPCT